MQKKVMSKMVSGLLVSGLLLSSVPSVSAVATDSKIAEKVTIGSSADGYSVDIPIFYRQSTLTFSPEMIGKINIEKTIAENDGLNFDAQQKIFIVDGTSQQVRVFFFDQITEGQTVTVSADSQSPIVYEIVPQYKGLEDGTESVADSSSESSEEQSTQESAESTEQTSVEDTSTAISATEDSSQKGMSGQADSDQQARKMKTVADLMKEDQQLGWSDQQSIRNLGEMTLESGAAVQYGFAAQDDLAETIIQLKTVDGQTIDYRNENSTGKYKAIRLYTREPGLLKDSYSVIPAIKIQGITAKDGAIRGYGEFDLAASAIYHYHFLVRLTLTPNPKQQTVTTTYELTRVDQPLADVKAFNQDFYQLTRVDLNHKSIDQAYFLGDFQGVFFKDDQYQANLKLTDGEAPNAWDVGEGTQWDLSIGVHWPIRPSEPKDFFTSNSLGLAFENQLPGQFIGQFDDPTIAMRWNKQVLSVGSSRKMSYDVMIDEPEKPELTVYAYNNILQQTDRSLDLSGSIQHASTLYYQVDDLDIDKIETKNQDWSLSIPTVGLSHGKHEVKLVAKNAYGAVSETAAVPFQVVNEHDRWIMDTEVKAVKGNINNLHIGDELEYVVTLDCISPEQIPTEAAWQYRFSKDFDVMDEKVTFRNRMHQNETYQVVDHQVEIPHFVASKGDTFTLTFRVKLKETSYDKKPTEMINDSMVKNQKNGKKIISDQYALTGTQKVRHLPVLEEQTKLETDSGKDELHENDAFTLKTFLKNDAVAYDLKGDVTGNLQKGLYTISKIKGLAYNEVKILKGGKEVPSSVASSSIQTEEESRQSGEKVLVTFQVDIKPQEAYEIQVKGKVMDASAVLQSEPIEISTTGKSGGEEHVEAKERVPLPKIIPTGEVWIDHVDEKLSLGDVKKTKDVQKIHAQSLNVDVEDTREEESHWTLELYSQIGLKTDSSKRIELFYQEDQEKAPEALSEGVEIKGNGTKHLDLAELIYAEIRPDTAVGDYQGVLNWELKDAP